MRSDENGWRFHANPSDSHSIHAHGETGRGATQFWPFQALRSAWVMSLHFPDGHGRLGFVLTFDRRRKLDNFILSLSRCRWWSDSRYSWLSFHSKPEPSAQTTSKATSVNSISLRRTGNSIFSLVLALSCAATHPTSTPLSDHPNICQVQDLRDWLPSGQPVSRVLHMPCGRLSSKHQPARLVLVPLLTLPIAETKFSMNNSRLRSTPKDFRPPNCTTANPRAPDHLRIKHSLLLGARLQECLRFAAGRLQDKTLSTPFPDLALSRRRTAS